MSRDDTLIGGLTDMPERDIRSIAEFLGLPLLKAQAVVWLTECHQRGSLARRKARAPKRKGEPGDGGENGL